MGLRKFFGQREGVRTNPNAPAQAYLNELVAEAALVGVQLEKLDRANPLDTIKALQRLVLLKAGVQGVTSWLQSAQQRADVYDTSKALTQYAKKNSIADIIYIDRSARPMRAGIKEYWGLAYPGEKHPDAHFLNPKLMKRPLERAGSSKLLLSIALGKTAGEFGRQLRDSSSTLLSQREAPILLVDGCIHSGKTLAMTKAVLQLNGFRDVRVGVFSDDRDPHAAIRSDVCAVVPSSTDDMICRPFGLDLSIRNDSDSIYATPLPGSVSRAQDMGLRAEISAVVREGFAAEHVSGF